MVNVLYIIWGVVGASLASFIICALERIHRSEPFMRGRSMCTTCKKNLHWFELVPIISFIALKGRCMKCRVPISRWYPVAEFCTGLLFMWVWWVHVTQETSITQWVRDIFFVTILFIIFIYDALYKRIIPSIIWIGIVGGVVFQLVLFSTTIVGDMVWGSMMGGSFFLAQHLISKGKWIGEGDIYVGFMIGVWLGSARILVALVISYILAASVGMILLIFKKKRLQSEIPLASFLSIGIFITLYFGDYFLKVLGF